MEYVSFVEKEYITYFTTIVSKINDEEQSRELMLQINRFDYLFQIHDSIIDLFESKRIMNEQFIELESDILIMIRELSSDTLTLFTHTSENLEQPKNDEIDKAARLLQLHLNQAQRKLLMLLADTNRKDAGTLTNFVTYSQRLKDKLLNLHKMYSRKNAEL